MKKIKVKTFRIYSLGCKVNQYDSGKLALFLKDKQIKQVESGADFAIVYSCAVTASAMSKNVKMITKARRENPGAKIILGGCWSKIGTIKDGDFGVDVFLPTDDEKAYCRVFGIDESMEIGSGTKAVSQPDRTRYFIKVQDGCEQFCSYCIIPYTRGKMKSRGREEILAEIKEAIRLGYGELILSGIHLGLYGHPSAYKLTDLIKDIINLKGNFRVRLSSIEPNEVSDELIRLIKEEKKLCRHLHIPLQSGTDKTLRLMNRPYTSQVYKEKIDKIRQSIPDIAISSDLIVGFPGESDEDFAVTYDFVRNLGFAKLHVFSFSAHKKTPAYSLPGRLGVEITGLRSKKMRDLSKQMEEKYRASFAGRELEVVLENISNGKAKLKTEYYFDIFVPAKGFDSAQVGRLLGEKYIA